MLYSSLMITFQRVSYLYPESSGLSPQSRRPALSDLSLHIEEGELILVIGPSGAGKSTFLRTLNGLVAHFYGGSLSGRLTVAGCDPVSLGPQAMSQHVGMVFQDPESQFVTDRVEDELAFGMENQALPPLLMRKRVEEVLDQLSIAHLQSRFLNTLSGGEKQRVAIAAVLTVHPQILVLDEPASQLDPQSAEEVLVAIRRLNEDLGLTVILAEHRLERVVQFVDRVLYLPGAGEEALLDRPRAVMEQVSLAPPLVDLGKARGWHPLPLTIKEGRRFVRQERQTARPLPVVQEPGDPVDSTGRPGLLSSAQRFLARIAAAELSSLGAARNKRPSPDAMPLIQADKLWHSYGGQRDALRGADISIWPGQVVALMGRNGSGKSTLLKHLVGLLKPHRGKINLQTSAGSLDVTAAGAKAVVKTIGYVPQNPDALLFKDTVLEELAFTRQGHGLPADPAADRHLLARLGLATEAERYPRDLSTGQRQRVALAAILVAAWAAACWPRLPSRKAPSTCATWRPSAARLSRLRAHRRNHRAGRAAVENDLVCHESLTSSISVKLLEGQS